MQVYKSCIDKVSLVRESSNVPKAKITTSQDAADYLRPLYDGIDIYESFFLLLLNHANNTIGWVQISKGGIAGTVADIRIIAKFALDCLATCAIISHNHPSGNLMPSEQDKNLTKRIKEALKIIDVGLIDHVILRGEDDKYTSFADEGIL